MKTRHPHLIAVVALIAGVATSAFAQTTPAPQQTAIAQAPASAAPARGHYGAMDPAKRQERFERRMAELKQKLQLSAAQEAAWTSFTNALRPAAGSRPDREALARMATPDRIDHLRALRNQRMADMDRRGEATKAFYTALNTEQKKTFDELSARTGRRHGGHGRHHAG